MSMSRLVTSASISNHYLIGYTRTAACDDLSTSDIVTVAESVLSLGAVTLALRCLIRVDGQGADHQAQLGHGLRA